MMPVEYRVTRPEDFFRFGIVLRDDVRPIGFTAWAGRRAVGLAGVVVEPNGEAMAHFAVTPDYRSVITRGLHRRSLKFLRRLSRTRITSLWATCDNDIPRAAAWLERLGFVPTDQVALGATVHVRNLQRD